MKCWYKIEWDKLQFFFGTFSRIHTYWRTDKHSHSVLGLAILNCFWSSTSYAHTFSSEKMVLTYKDYKMACQTMANSKSSSWSFHLCWYYFYILFKNWNQICMHKIGIDFFDERMISLSIDGKLLNIRRYFGKQIMQLFLYYFQWNTIF